MIISLADKNVSPFGDLSIALEQQSFWPPLAGKSNLTPLLVMDGFSMEI